jgi:hypothetical protein
LALAQLAAATVSGTRRCELLSVERRPLLVRFAVPADGSYALWQRAALLLRDAANLAGDQESAGPVRGRAAQLCRVLASQVALDEALCSDAMRAANACAATFPVAHDLLHAALELAPDPARLILPMRRSCEGRKPKADPMAKRTPGIPGPTHLSRTVRYVTTCGPN